MNHEYEIGKRYPWDGGDCPVPDDTLVTVIFQNGQKTTKSTADDWDWEERGDYGIVEFVIEKSTEVIISEPTKSPTVIFLNEYQQEPDGPLNWSIGYNTREEAESHVLNIFGTFKRTVKFVEVTG